MRTYDSYYGTSTATPAYSDGDIGRITNNLNTDNLNWGLQELNQSLRYLTTKFYFNERTYAVPGGTQAGIQFYNLPPQVKKLINVTVLIGGTLWQPKECPSREYWDYLNTQTFDQDYPSFFFVYDGKVGLWPVPASSSNPVTMHYKTRIVDLSMPDVTDTTSGNTVSITTNTPFVTASNDTFLNWMAGQWIRVPHSSLNPTNGDNQWYQIASVQSPTVLILDNNYSGNTVLGAAFTVGETPILPEDYQDLPLFRMGYIYYTTRFPDKGKASLYENLYDRGYADLNDEFGSKTTNVILPDTDQPIFNPNLFQSNIT